MPDLAAEPVDRSLLVRMFAALSQPSRLAVFVEVLSAGPAGVSTQGLSQSLGTTGSALTLHLRSLESAGLIHVQVRRRGQSAAHVVARIENCAALGAWVARQCQDAGWDITAGAAPPPSLRQSPSLRIG